jgi:hypothetical protein
MGYHSILQIYILFLPEVFATKMASFVLNSEQHFICQQNLYCLLTGGAVLYVAKL